jgi:hypothetical protein
MSPSSDVLLQASSKNARYFGSFHLAVACASSPTGSPMPGGKPQQGAHDILGADVVDMTQ